MGSQWVKQESNRDRKNFGFSYGFGMETACEVSCGLVLVSANRVSTKLQQRPKL